MSTAKNVGQVNRQRTGVGRDIRHYTGRTSSVYSWPGPKGAGATCVFGMRRECQLVRLPPVATVTNGFWDAAGVPTRQVTSDIGWTNKRHDARYCTPPVGHASSDRGQGVPLLLLLLPPPLPFLSPSLPKLRCRRKRSPRSRQETTHSAMRPRKVPAPWRSACSAQSWATWAREGWQHARWTI